EPLQASADADRAPLRQRDQPRPGDPARLMPPSAGRLLLVATPICNLDDLSPRARDAIEPIPGPSALLAALVASGLPPYPFTFAGFAPPRQGKRRTFYRSYRDLGHTLVLFESPH